MFALSAFKTGSVPGGPLVYDDGMDRASCILALQGMKVMKLLLRRDRHCAVSLEIAVQLIQETREIRGSQDGVWHDITVLASGKNFEDAAS